MHLLPMYDTHEEHPESDIADLQNVGRRAAGAITGRKFLEHFVDDAPWMHLDIAGPVFRKTEQSYRPEGGTGFGVRLLVDYLRTIILARKQA